MCDVRWWWFFNALLKQDRNWLMIALYAHLQKHSHLQAHVSEKISICNHKVTLHSKQYARINTSSSSAACGNIDATARRPALFMCTACSQHNMYLYMLCLCARIAFAFIALVTAKICDARVSSRSDEGDMHNKYLVVCGLRRLYNVGKTMYICCAQRKFRMLTHAKGIFS